MDIREVFARNLRKARNAKRLSQEALADEAGVDRTYVSALERGVYNATIVMVAKLAKALNVEPSALFQRKARPGVLSFGATRIAKTRRRSYE